MKCDIGPFIYGGIVMKVRQIQLDALQQARLSDFAQELSARARDRHPAASEPLSDDDLLARITDEILAARAIGLRTRGELKRFCDLSMLIGFGFAASTVWARDLFAAPRFAPRDRLGQVEETAVFALAGG
ncbi:MAG: hypothetical protein ACJA1L_001845 [Paracoccaceae bacterium]